MSAGLIWREEEENRELKDGKMKGKGSCGREDEGKEKDGEEEWRWKREDKMKTIGGESGWQEDDEEMREGEERGNWQRKETSSEKLREDKGKTKDRES